MKPVLILGFALAVFATPVQAQSSKPAPLIFNGMIFDPEPAPGYAAQPAVNVKPARHVRKHRVRSAT